MKFELNEDNASMMKHIGQALVNIAHDLDPAVASNLENAYSMKEAIDDVIRECDEAEQEMIDNLSGHVRDVTATPPQDGTPYTNEMMDDNLKAAAKVMDIPVETLTVEPDVEELIADLPPSPPLFEAVDTRTGLVQHFFVKQEMEGWISQAPEHRHTDADQYNQLAADASKEVPPAPEGELDTDGLSWDGRIHSKGRTKIKAGTWKIKKKPADMTKLEWSATVANVQTECRQALNGEVVEQAEAVVLRKELALHIKAPVDIPPPPPVTEAPVDIPPPPPLAEAPTVTFAELMKLVTSNLEIDSIAKVNTILIGHGLAGLPVLNSTRPDLISTIYAELKTTLGV